MFLPQEPHSYSNGASSCRLRTVRLSSMADRTTTPEHVTIRNPVVGDEATTETILLGKSALHNRSRAFSRSTIRH